MQSTPESGLKNELQISNVTHQNKPQFDLIEKKTFLQVSYFVACGLWHLFSLFE